MIAVYGSGSGASKSRLQQLFHIFDPLGGIIEDWGYANSSGTGFNISISPELFNWMNSSGAAVMTQPGVYVVGGVLVRVVVTGAAILTAPVVLTVTGVAATAAVGYWIYMAGQDLAQVRAAGGEVAREPGCRKPEPRDFDRLHEILRSQKQKGDMVSYDTILEAWRGLV